MMPSLPKPGIRFARFVRASMLPGLAAVAALLLSGSATNAQPALKLRFAFDDSAGTTTPSDTSLGSEVSVSLQMLSSAAASTNLHGPAGSGVAALTNPNRALNLSTNKNQGGSGGSFAAVTNSALAFPSVTSFAASMWMKQSVTMSGNTLGRMFILGNSTNTDAGTPNSIGMKWQGPNQLYFYVNAVQCGMFFPQADTNGWIFVAMTYDGNNVVLYEGTDKTPAVALSTNAAVGQSVPLASAMASLFIGNRLGRDRAFCGWIDDFRFYTGTGADANFVESIRQSAAGPAGLVAVPNDSQVALTWNALTGAASYNVKRATTSGGPYTTISTAGTVTTTSYTDSTAANGTTYYYTVSAVSGSGVESANSAIEASATPSVPPPAPTNLAATTPAPYQIGLTWTASAGAANYNVKRSLTSGTEVTIVNVTGTSYTDTNLVNGTPYYYVVSAVNATQAESANSSEISATPVGPPPVPTGLAAFGAGISQIGLSWNASPLATSYNVYRDTSSGGSFSTKVSTDGAVTTTGFTDTTVSDSLTYYYEVSAVNANGESPKSAPVAGVGMTPKLRFDFSDTGTTTTDSVTGVRLNMVNGSNVAADYHSTANSGVAGAGKTLDFSSNLYNSPASGPLASTTGNTALNFGSLSNFTLTFWVKPSYDFYTPAPGAPDMSVSNNPRLFLLSPTNYTDYPGAIPSSQSGLYMKINSYDASAHHGQLKVFLGSGASTTEYVTPENSFVSALGLWSFVAVTYDGSALKVYSATSTNSANLILTQPMTNVLALTNAVGGNLLLGNNGALAKGIAGWMTDFRLYAGAGGSGFVENVRMLAANPPAGVSALGGDNQVTLNWTGLGSATSYNIKRATASGGPYTTISSPGSVTGRSFTDSTAIDNNTYYYVISAATPYGESANSAEVSATASCTPPPTAGNNGPLCAGGTLNLTASTVDGATYNWTGPNSWTSTDQNPVIPAATTAASGVYSVTVTVGACTSAPATTTVLVKPTPTTPTAGNNGPLCAGSTLNLTASTIAGATYSWSGPNGFTSTAQNPSIPNATSDASGTYSVIVMVNGCTSAAGTTAVTVNPIPAAPVAGNDGPIYAGSTLHLTASSIPGATYSWTGPNGFTSTEQNPSIPNATTNASGLYSVTATVNACPSPAGTTLVTVNPLLQVSLTIQASGTNIILGWPAGTLQSATNVLGPWDDVTNAVPPSYTNLPSDPCRFFRVKVQ